MKKLICLVLCAVMLFALSACGAKTETPAQETPAQETPATAEPAAEWTRSGYFTDENNNMLSVTWMEDIDEPGWYVGVMLGEDFIEDAWGGTLQQDGSGTEPESIVYQRFPSFRNLRRADHICQSPRFCLTETGGL